MLYILTAILVLAFLLARMMRSLERKPPFSHFFRPWFDVLDKRNSTTYQPFRLFRPSLEILESRTAPALLTWTGAIDSNWSTARNWVDDLGNHAVPTATDDVQFTQQYNKFSIVDPGFQAGAGTVASLTIDQGHTAQINLQESLTVQTTNQSDGSIFGSPSYIVPAGGVYNWINGSLKGFGTRSTFLYQTIIRASATLNINSALAHQLNGRTIQNNGTINWNTVNSTVNITNGGLLNNFGIFNVPQVAGGFVVDGDQASGFYNQGTVQVGNQAILSFLVPYTNNSPGVLKVTGAASIAGWFAPATLNDGSLITGGGETNVFSILTVNGTVTNAAIMNAATGSAIFSNGKLEVTGSLYATGCAIQGQLFHIAPGADFEIQGNLTIGGIVKNDGVGNLGSNFVGKSKNRFVGKESQYC